MQPDWSGQSDDAPPPPLYLPPPLTAHPEPGRPAAGTLGPEGRHSDGGQVRHLGGAAIWSHDRKLHLLGSGQPIRVQEVSSAQWFRGSRSGRCSSRSYIIAPLSTLLIDLINRVNFHS